MTYEPYGIVEAPVDFIEIQIHFKDLNQHFSEKKKLIRNWLNEWSIGYSVGFADYVKHGASQPYYVDAQYALIFKLTWGGLW